MNVRLLIGTFINVDGKVLEDLEAIAAGTITQVAARTGEGDCSFDNGTFIQR